MTRFLNQLPFAHHRWFMYVRLLIQHFLDDNCPQKSASLTYTTLLSVVPVIAVLLVVVSGVPALAQVKGQIQSAIYENLLPSSGYQLSQYIDEFAQKSSNVTIVGIVALFVTTIMTLITIETAFNQIWRVQNRTGGLKSLVRYWMMITLGPIILGVAFTASGAIKGLDFLNQRVAGYGIDWGIYAQIVSFLVMIAGFVGMYWFIPKVSVPLKNATIAGIIIAILFECIKRIFGVVVSNFTSYEAIYGAFAILPVFLMWVYVSWNLILLGVEMSYTLTIFETKEVPVRHPLLSLLDMLNLIYKNYQHGQSTSEQALRDVLGRKELPKWQIYLSQLNQHGLITKTDDDKYTLKKDLYAVNLWQFYQSLPYPLPIKDELENLIEHDDVWYHKLYEPLVSIEKTTKSALDMPLASLFGTTPIREKQETIAIVDDKEGVDTQGFDAGANAITDNQSNIILLPQGKSVLTKQVWARVNGYVGMGKRLAQQGKQKLKDKFYR